MTDAPTPLQAIRARLALAVGENAVFDGWTGQAVDTAAAQLGIDPAQARLAFPKSKVDMVESYVDAIDVAMLAAFPPEKIAAMKIRDRIRSQLWFRLETMAPAREALRSALSILAMPQNALRASRLGWRTADIMWRNAGDTSSDFNHYTKRLTLSAVYGSTLLAWIDDRSEEYADTAAFLDRRLGNVMSFEKWKGQWKGSDLRRPSVARFLGRLRYPPA
jgi:ubiquinone biosynthesis protein COQ9